MNRFTYTKYSDNQKYLFSSLSEIRASYDTSERTLQTDIVPQYKPISMLEDTQAVRSVCFHPSGQIHAIGANSKIMRICKTTPHKAQDTGTRFQCFFFLFDLSCPKDAFFIEIIPLFWHHQRI